MENNKHHAMNYIKSVVRNFTGMVFLVLSVFPGNGYAQATENIADTWYAYVPPSGMEKDLPPYDKWVELMEEDFNESPVKSGNAIEFSTEDVSNFKSDIYSYIFTMSLLPDSKQPSSFQINHVIFYNPSTKEFRKAKWGWK